MNKNKLQLWFNEIQIEMNISYSESTAPRGWTLANSVQVCWNHVCEIMEL